ncbi:MAG TPA: adenylate synthase [Flavobacteriales bacterium]|nr:adenylate synthase [Flavobacteriales bacterium]
MKTPFKLKVVQYLIRIYFERWSFERNPKRHQERMWLKLQKHVLSRSPKYNSLEFQDLKTFPIQEKKEFMGDFNAINTQELDFNEAMEIAVKAENSRDFTPTIKGLTVGLSSGTSGNRGLFVVSENERAMWVAVIIQRVIKWSFKKRKVAFFLRANSNLYSSVQSKLIAFHFFDLLSPMEDHIRRIQQLQPDIVVGQPSLLKLLAEAQKNNSIQIQPQKVISVAEVLSPEDEKTIENTFMVPVQQVYQCAEGMLGQTCKHGNLHLNEDGLIVEKEWLDNNRFIPIITDLRRNTQPIIRYKMNDILHATECTCGSKMQALTTIEGRMDDVLQFGQDKIIFPDFIRRTIIGASPEIDNYQVIQVSYRELSLFISDVELWEAAASALDAFFKSQGIPNIAIFKSDTLRHEKGSKLRRIHAKSSPTM